jgi:hypothetical protein
MSHQEKANPSVDFIEADVVATLRDFNGLS